IPGTSSSPQADAPAPDPAIQAIVTKVDADRLKADVARLTALPSRHSGSESCDQAARLIRDRFVAAGHEDVSFHEFRLGEKTCRNVVCTKKGLEPNGPIILIGAHYDCRSRDLDDPDAPAPGADDNAGGTAGLLELARVLKGVATKQTLRFIAFAGEEQGLVGSTAYAKFAHDENLNIQAMINMDMIGHPM